MRNKRWITLLGIFGLTVTASMGQAPVIKSFKGNGQLSWTNAMDTNALYRVEWAAQTDGPWHSFTYQPINTIDAHSSTSFEVEVPMFYRVVMTTNQPPQGMAWIDSDESISGFWIDTTEVTFKKWQEVYNWAVTNGYEFDHTGSGKAANHPVQTVNWYDCVKWCNARSEKEGVSPCYYTTSAQTTLYRTGQTNFMDDCVNWMANGYRLPKQAEWEKAARGGRQGRRFPWGGDTIQHSQANYYAKPYDAWNPGDVSPTSGYHPDFQAGGTPYTSPVGSFQANGYGLYDMAGNVLEWCWDWRVMVGTSRIWRGGSWGDQAFAVTCEYNNSSTAPEGTSNRYGFRCVRLR